MNKPTSTDAATPRRLHFITGKIGEPINIWNERETVLFAQVRPTSDLKTDVERAALIVRAVNLLQAHKAVAEAAEFAETALSAVMASQSHLPPAQRNQGLERLRKALAHLAKLEEENK